MERVQLANCRVGWMGRCRVVNEDGQRQRKIRQVRLWIIISGKIITDHDKSTNRTILTFVSLWSLFFASISVVVLTSDS